MAFLIMRLLAICMIFILRIGKPGKHGSRCFWRSWHLLPWATDSTADVNYVCKNLALTDAVVIVSFCCLINFDKSNNRSTRGRCWSLVIPAGAQFVRG